jgi:putative phosphoesterase
MMAAGVRALRERGAAFFIHCGDVCTPNLLDHLAGLPSAFVYGNCDWDRLALQRYAQSIDVPCYGAFADLELDGKRVAVLHGDDRTRLETVLHAQGHDYLFHGHTHVRRDERVGKTRVINPGALFRASQKTVALLDTVADRLEYLVIEQPGGAGGA